MLQLDQQLNYPIVFDGDSIQGMNLTGAVYLWTRNDVPCYVGLTVRKIFKRISEHLISKDNTFKFQNILQAHKEEFKCYILYNSDSMEWLKRAEVYFIKCFNTYYKNNKNYGYNMTEGGDGTVGYRHTDAAKQAVSIANKGKPSPCGMAGKHHTDATKQIQREASKLLVGENNGMFGRTHTTEEKQRRSKAFSGSGNPMYGKPSARRGVTLTDETKALISLKKKLWWKSRESVKSNIASYIF